MKIYHPISKIILSTVKPDGKRSISTMEVIRLAWSEQLLCTAGEAKNAIVRLQCAGKIS